MLKIPLIQPRLPLPSKWVHLLDQSFEQSTFTNFGPAYSRAVNALTDIPQYSNIHPVLVSNGTVAIQTALQATLPLGSRVAVPHFTFMATLNAVVAAGMKPVIIESHPDDWTIDFDILERQHNEYDAFIVVSPMGHSVDVATYDDLAERLEKKVVYDFAAAAFNRISSEHPTTLSFHATKNIPIGEGGAVLFPTEHQAKIAKELINFDFNSAKNPYTINGFNGKLDELHSALLLYQLTEGLSGLINSITERQGISRRYADVLSEWFDSHPTLWDNDCNPQMSILRPKSKEIMSKVCMALERQGIGHRKYYHPTLFDMHCTQSIPKFRIPNNQHMGSCLALPTYLGVDELLICDIIIASLKESA